MKKWNLLETATTPDGEQLRLFEHDGDYVIRVSGVDLMSTRQKASEEKLAQVGCEALTNKSGARILIGGLGLGFTLRATLARLPQNAEVVVAELIPAVVQWNSNPAYPLCAQALQDPRVRVQIGDVSAVIESSSNTFDAILLDVDNGPSALTVKSNHQLYGPTGVRKIRNALRIGGRACVWSVSDSPEFSKLISRNGFAVQTVRAAAHTSGGGNRVIFVATKVD